MTDWLRRHLKNPRTWQLALAGFWIALFVSTHIPSSVPILPKPGFDKVVHFTAFAILAGLLATTWQMAGGHLTTRHLVAVWIVLVLYAALDEWTQIPVGRDCSIWDWTADALGVMFALVLFAQLRSKFMVQ
jgi:VanZ family protein